MSENTASKVLLAAFFAAVGIVTYYDLRGKGAITAQGTVGRGAVPLPDPRGYVGVGIVFAMLGVLASFAPGIAALAGAGTVLGTWITRAGKNTTSTALNAGGYNPNVPLNLSETGSPYIQLARGGPAGATGQAPASGGGRTVLP